MISCYPCDESKGTATRDAAGGGGGGGGGGGWGVAWNLTDVDYEVTLRWGMI